MAKQITLTRQEAELLVDVLEDNFKTGKFEQAGIGADVAYELRELFGMPEAQNLEYKSDALCDECCKKTTLYDLT